LQAWLAKLGRSAKQAHRTLALEVLQALAAQPGGENAAEAEQPLDQAGAPLPLNHDVLATVIGYTCMFFYLISCSTYWCFLSRVTDKSPSVRAKALAVLTQLLATLPAAAANNTALQVVIRICDSVYDVYTRG
jgi:hypothetical protein